MTAVESSAYIRSLVSGYPARLRSEKLLVMLQAYVDDSISPSGDRRLYLAAYVHHAEAWAEFSDAWDAALRAEPAVESFHMVEAQNRRGAFKGWSEAARNKKVRDLAAVIYAFGPWGVHASVSVASFNRLVKPFVPHPLGTPYHPLFFAVIFGVARIHDMLGLTVPCDFIFDEHDGLPRKVLPFWDLMAEPLAASTKRLIGGQPIFRDDTKVLPLQAADMLVWHLRREASGDYPAEYQGVLDTITLPGGHYYLDLDDATLEGLSARFQSVPLASALSSKAAFKRFTDELGDDWEAFFKPGPWGSVG